MSMLGSHRVAIDVLGGASFLVLPRDDIGREVLALGGETLPSSKRAWWRRPTAARSCRAIIFHPPDATPLIDEICGRRNSAAMSSDDLCDALLRMQHAFRNSVAREDRLCVQGRSAARAGDAPIAESAGRCEVHA